MSGDPNSVGGEGELGTRGISVGRLWWFFNGHASS